MSKTGSDGDGLGLPAILLSSSTEVLPCCWQSLQNSDNEDSFWKWARYFAWLLYLIAPGLSMLNFQSVQSLSRVWFFATPWIPACQASQSNTNSRSSLRLMSIVSVMPSSHLILCHLLYLLPPLPPSISLFQWVNSSREVAKVLEFRMAEKQEVFYAMDTATAPGAGWGALISPRGFSPQPGSPGEMHYSPHTQFTIVW